MNPNHDDEPGMDQHAVRVWGNYIENSGFSKILVIAHSAGGGCLSSIQKKFAKTFYT